MLKSKSKKLLLGALLCICAAFFVLPSIIVSQKAYAYKTAELPTGNNVINLDDDSSTKFTENGLNQLAAAAGYSDLKDMMDSATTEGISLTASFTDRVVRLGKDTTAGGDVLKWVPVYLSQSEEDKNGDGTNDAVLTLWQATDVYASTWSDGTYSTTATKSFNGSTIYSNTYDGSFIRHKLNGKTGWTTEWGEGNAQSSANDNIRTLVSNFYGSGVFADCVTTPANVSWQANANKMKNDPNWAGSGAVYYPCDWLNDNVWLPSVYEAGDSTLAAHSVTTTFTYNGGLWQVKKGNICSVNNSYSWTRSGRSNSPAGGQGINSGGSTVLTGHITGFGVRPAIHINLESALAAAEPDHVHVWQSAANDGWVQTKAPTCSAKGEEARVCTAAGCTLTNSTETRETAIDPTAHSYDTTTWKSDGTNHWHECSACGAKDTLVAHTAGAAATCTADQTCTVCSRVITPALNHNFTGAAWSSNPTNHWHVCTNTGCTATDTPAAHTFQWIVDTPATVTTTGVQHEECNVCGFAKSQGTVIPIVTCNHPNTTHNAAVTATCVSTGNVEFWHCNDCNKDLDSSGAVITNTSTAIDPNNHSFTNYVYNNDATCTLDGTETATCARNCGATDTRTKTGTALNHDFNNALWSTGTSNHWHVCTRTGCTVTDTPAAHTFQWVIDTAATVTSTGIKHEECSVCGYAQSQGTVIPVLTCAHNNKTHYPAVAATCMQQGNVEYWYCSDCLKNVDSAGLELTTLVTQIDPNNHSYTNYLSNNDATCNADGTKTAQCDHGCGAEDTVTDTGTMLSHSYTNYVSDSNATCTADGTKTAQCDHGCGAEDTVTDTGTMLSHSYTNYVSDSNATCTADGTKTAQCDHGCGAEDTVTDTGSMLSHSYTTYTSDSNATCTADGTKTATCDYGCGATDIITDTGSALEHNYEWVITKEATTEEAGLMENKCTVCGDKDGEQEIAKLVDPNGEIDLPIDVHVEFKVTQSSTGNNYSDIDNSLKLGYWAQLWYRNDDGTLGDEFTDTINCFLTLKIPTDIIEAIRGGEEINRDKIAAGLKVFYIDGDGLPVEVENFTIAMRDDDSWQIKFNYNEKFRAEVVFAADLTEQPAPEPEQAGIPWWVWLIVGISVVVIIILIVVIALAAKNKKNGGGGSQYDDGELKAQLAEQSEKIDELLGRDDGGFNTPVELDENGNVIFK